MIDLDPSARQLATVARAVDHGQLDQPTPCEAWTVCELLAHVLDLTESLRLTAYKEVGVGPKDPKAPREPAAIVDPGGEWRDRLDQRLEALVEAWRRPEAWEGTAEAGGVTMPAPIMGQVVVDELVLHGWDLARATGQAFDCDPASLDAVIAFTTAMADPSMEAGREGLFGLVVDVSDRASRWEQALAMSGRDPRWEPTRRDPAD